MTRMVEYKKMLLYTIQKSENRLNTGINGNINCLSCPKGDTPFHQDEKLSLIPS